MILSACVPPALAQTEKTAPATWPSFRGPHARGVVPGDAPTEWNAPAGKNVLWKKEIPGLGLSSPVIWGDRIFLTTAVPRGADASLKVGLYGNINSVQDEPEQTWRVLCLDRTSGKLLWERTAHEGLPKVKRHTKSSHANPSPATDGKHVVAFFGSEGLYCYDLDGTLLWKKDLGTLDSGFYMVRGAQWGFGSSPVIHQDRVIVQCDVQEGSFIAAFDLTDGREIWRTPRKDLPTWGTPTVHSGDCRTQVIVNGCWHIGGYDVETGRELWKLARAGDIPVPTPVVADGLVFLTSAHGPLAPIYAVRTDATGDITLPEGQTTNEYIAWSRPNRGNYMQTPLVVGEYLYCCMDNGILTCYEAATGETHYRQRLGEGSSGFTASPVAAGDSVYFTSETGDVYVVKAGPEFELQATNSMGEVCMATPAIADGRLYIRTQQHLFAIGE